MTPSRPQTRALEFWIDRGGTFTDIVMRTDDARIEVGKYLSHAPGQYTDAAIHGMADLARRAGFDDLSSAPISAIRMGTTVATNALLERAGNPTVLITTKGFADALIIAEQHRPDIFALDIRRPPALFKQVIEIDERINASGEVVRSMDLQPLGIEQLKVQLHCALMGGATSAAVVLMHGYLTPEHEQHCARLAREAGFAHVSMSHEVSAQSRLIGRGDTTVVDAYLTPVLQRYVRTVARGIGKAHAARLQFMQSNGGLAPAAAFRGYNSVLSGPAGGVVGMVRTAAEAGFDRLIGFDMGGTSTDITLYDGEFETRINNTVDGVRLQTPMLAVHTIAAGGGSLLRYADGRLQVGPASAGAHPGPACYGLDGALAVTDIQAALGRLQPDCFPAVFGPDGDRELDIERPLELFATLATQVPGDHSAASLAQAFLDVAIDKMALAIRKAALSRGIDVDAFCLSGFGGAAGQHVCAVAKSLGLRRVLVHPQASVLSAVGIGLADQRAGRLESVNQPLNEHNIERLEPRFERLSSAASADLDRAQPDRVERQLRLRYAGSDTVLDVALTDAPGAAQAFHQLHEKRFGVAARDDEIIIEGIAVQVIVHGSPVTQLSGSNTATDVEVRQRPVWFQDAWHTTPMLPRPSVTPGQEVNGPAIIFDAHSTIVVEPGWRAKILPDGQLLLQDDATTIKPQSDSAVVCEPARLEQFNNLFTHIAEQMGLVLQKTARSVNIKERLDFSCALFDRSGRLLANAPHMPVHLGSMGESVRAVMRAFPQPARGDNFALNDPYAGGTHLPDITVVTPYFCNDGPPAFYLAARGHHADVGGTSPGSMPADSRHIDDEGVLISPMRLVRAGVFEDAAIRQQLAGARFPARNIEQNIADLFAQLAANRSGVNQLNDMIDAHGLTMAEAYAGFVQDNAALAVREVIAKIEPGHHVVEMDGGERIEVRVRRRGDRVEVDFHGSSAQVAGNFNAPAAVCRAAVLYVFRCLVARPIPMNAGCLEPVDLMIPEGSFLAPKSPAAVAAGNVETSTCITEALFGALGVLAAGQGTMNNVTFGNDEVQYYETLCGGAGAGDGFNGCDAIHTHMTNSRLTDPEILEQRFPLRVLTFAIRHSSGGTGRWRGGNGMVREYEFLAPMTVSLLGNRRSTQPFGLHGGGPGAAGINTLWRAGTQEYEILNATATVKVAAGDRLKIETPGGGGFGKRKKIELPLVE
ncbi:MAG: hydantoinase B/oxoprolinase family protein [Gammaproteobacteria bacterium]